MEVDRWTDLLGGLLERHPGLWTRLGDWETRAVRDRIAHLAVDRPIYIAGLARSGSTILLELLSQHGETATHRYRDFPLVPTLWAWNWFLDRAAGNRASQTPAERAHKDRISVTPDSPEAFEEILWMAFHPSLHDPAHCAILDERTANPRFETFYRDHIRKLLALRGGGRYLAKGNYNVTRIRYLRKLFPHARFIVPIRDPAWHVASLMKQHRIFTEAGANDARIQHHMRRSGHFEFGLDRRPVNTGDSRLTAKIRALWRDGKEAEGWALCWTLIYGHVADLVDDPAVSSAIHVVRYEDFCATPRVAMTAILDHCELAPGSLPDTAEAVVSPPTYYEPTFTRMERDAIRHISARTAAQFGYE